MPIYSTCSSAKNQWEYILNKLNISTNRKESPCPACGGKTRYRFDDLEGRGTHFCSHCGAGDGLNIIMKTYNCNALEAAKKVADVLGLQGLEQNQPRKQENKKQQCRKKSIAHTVTALLKYARKAESKYLNQKGLKGMHNILNDGSLLLPLKTIDGDITGAQIIQPNGEKRLISGTKKKGAFIAINELNGYVDTIIIAEGYATALTVDMIADGYVVAAVDAGNLLPVAEAFRQRYPNADIYIGGDSDVSEDGNVGQDAAIKAARAVGGKFSLPKTDYKCDWNDYFQAKGVEIAKRDFQANLKIPMNKVGRPSNPNKVKMPIVEFPCDLDINERTGKYKSTFRNVYQMSSCTDITNFRFAYDKFRASEMTFVNNTWEEINDNTLSKFRIRLEELGVSRTTKDDTRSIMNLIAEENNFDSGIDWIQSLKWDGKERVKNFFSQYFLANGDSEYIESVSQYTWTALAGRMMQPGIKADMVPVLFGEQGLGKSTGVEKMAPFLDSFTKVDLTKKDEDLARKIRGCVIAEWEELRGLNGRDSESTKAFISATSDKWIPKYKEFATTNPRRLLFIGTTNKQEILTDCTGNRRYLPLEVGKVDFDAIERDRDQLWAEALVLFKQHGIIGQTAERLAKKHHEEYRVKDAWEDDLSQYLEVGTTKEMPFASISALFSRLGLVIGHTNRSHSERLKNIMSLLGYQKGQGRVDGQFKKGYRKTPATQIATNYLC